MEHGLKRYILAIDPGNEQSAFCIWDIKGDKPLIDFQKMPNDDLLDMIRRGLDESNTGGSCKTFLGDNAIDTDMVIEMVASYGMPVGREIFETCVWTGRFLGAWEYLHWRSPRLAYRKDIRLHHCNHPRANDATVRQALMDKYGGKGTKANPGPFYGVSADVWAAIAVATYAAEGGELHAAV